jgi:hypothetical protein
MFGVPRVNSSNSGTTIQSTISSKRMICSDIGRTRRFGIFWLETSPAQDSGQSILAVRQANATKSNGGRLDLPNRAASFSSRSVENDTVET